MDTIRLTSSGGLPGRYKVQPIRGRGGLRSCLAGHLRLVLACPGGRIRADGHVGPAVGGMSYIDA